MGPAARWVSSTGVVPSGSRRRAPRSATGRAGWPACSSSTRSVRPVDALCLRAPAAPRRRAAAPLGAGPRSTLPRVSARPATRRRSSCGGPSRDGSRSTTRRQRPRRRGPAVRRVLFPDRQPSSTGGRGSCPACCTRRSGRRPTTAASSRVVAGSGTGKKTTASRVLGQRLGDVSATRPSVSSTTCGYSAPTPSPLSVVMDPGRRRGVAGASPHASAGPRTCRAGARVARLPFLRRSPDVASLVLQPTSRSSTRWPRCCRRRPRYPAWTVPLDRLAVALAAGHGPRRRPTATSPIASTSSPTSRTCGFPSPATRPGHVDVGRGTRLHGFGGGDRGLSWYSSEVHAARTPWPRGLP